MDNLRQPQLGKQKPFQYKKRNKTLFFSSLCLYSASHPFLLVLQWQHYVIGTTNEKMSNNETHKKLDDWFNIRLSNSMILPYITN